MHRVRSQPPLPPTSSGDSRATQSSRREQQQQSRGRGSSPTLQSRARSDRTSTASCTTSLFGDSHPVCNLKYCTHTFAQSRPKPRGTAAVRLLRQIQRVSKQEQGYLSLGEYRAIATHALHSPACALIHGSDSSRRSAAMHLRAQIFAHKKLRSRSSPGWANFTCQRRKHATLPPLVRPQHSVLRNPFSFAHHCVRSRRTIHGPDARSDWNL